MRSWCSTAATTSSARRLRTGTQPQGISLSADQKLLLVANADSQYCRGVRSGHAPAADADRVAGRDTTPAPSRSRTPECSRSSRTTPRRPGSVDRLDLVIRCAVQPPSLGIWENKLDAESVVTSTPGQASILLVEPNGNIKLYDAQADTWVLSRKDFTSLSGAYAATDRGPRAPHPRISGTFVVGNNILNRALVPDRDAWTPRWAQPRASPSPRRERGSGSPATPRPVLASSRICARRRSSRPR